MIRQIIDDHRKLAIGFSIAAIVAVVGYLFYFINWGNRAQVPYFPQQAYYTADDGQTLFADAIAKVPPFERNGSEAVRAYVFTCDGGVHHWVQYLEKYSDDAIKSWQQAAPGSFAKGASPSNEGLLVKKPGSQQWLRETDPRAMQIIRPQTPDGMGNGTAIAAMP